MRAHYLAVLGLDESASEKDIKKAYRKLSMKYHPDISKEENATEKFIEIDQAYDYLTSPSKPYEYQPITPNEPEETAHEKWRREARARQRAAANQKALYQLQLLKRFNRLARYFVIAFCCLNAFLALDYLLPAVRSKQVPVEFEKVFSRGRNGSRGTYTHDKIIFENVTLNLKTGSIAIAKEASSFIVTTTPIFKTPFYLTLELAEGKQTLKHILSIYYPFGFLIPILLLISILYFISKSENRKLSLSLVTGFFIILQIFVLLMS